MRLVHDGHCIMALALLFGILSHGVSALLVKRECDVRRCRAPGRIALISFRLPVVPANSVGGGFLPRPQPFEIAVRFPHSYPPWIALLRQSRGHAQSTTTYTDPVDSISDTEPSPAWKNTAGFVPWNRWAGASRTASPPPAGITWTSR